MSLPSRDRTLCVAETARIAVKEPPLPDHWHYRLIYIHGVGSNLPCLPYKDADFPPDCGLGGCNWNILLLRLQPSQALHVTEPISTAEPLSVCKALVTQNPRSPSDNVPESISQRQ